MNIHCPFCPKRYSLDPAALTGVSFTVRCKNCGTVIAVTLPFNWKEKLLGPSKPASPPVPPPAAGKRSILLVDDTVFFRKIFSDLLQGAGYRVSEANNGEEALHILAENPGRFSLILLDLQMPRMSGFEVLQRLQNRQDKVPPIVVMTGVHDSHEAISQVRELGAAGFLDKSLEPTVALERIKNAIS